MTLYTKYSAYFVDPGNKKLCKAGGEKLVAFDHVQRCPEDRLEFRDKKGVLLLRTLPVEQSTALKLNELFQVGSSA
jgi:hypothetical protein